jgi:hypothetical protein
VNCIRTLQLLAYIPLWAHEHGPTCTDESNYEANPAGGEEVLKQASLQLRKANSLIFFNLLNSKVVNREIMKNLRDEPELESFGDEFCKLRSGAPS